VKKAVNFMRGNICVEIECPSPTRFVNVCAQSGIEFWRLKRVSPNAVTAYMHIGGYRRLQSLAKSAGFTVRQIKKTGVPFFLAKVRRRYLLLFGMALCLLTVHTMSLFIWEMRVHGNENISTQLILAMLEELGVSPGSFGPSIEPAMVQNDMILRIPELSWIAVNIHGSRAQVIVRERIPRPDIIDETRPVMIYASKPGEIIRVSVLEGKPVIAVGDIAEQGDIIVTGIMDSIASGGRAVHAIAAAYARTWYEKSAKMPLEAVIKEHTGNTQTRRSIVIGGSRINLFFNSRISMANYDKITSEGYVRLPTGNRLPISMIRVEYVEYIPQKFALSVSDAERILQYSLLNALLEEIGDGEIVSSQFVTTVENGVVTVTLTAECIEQIAAARDFTADELYEAQMAPGLVDLHNER
jgi:similar to stage IV sporulation protein